MQSKYQYITKNMIKSNPESKYICIIQKAKACHIMYDILVFKNEGSHITRAYNKISRFFQVNWI